MKDMGSYVRNQAPEDEAEEVKDEEAATEKECVIMINILMDECDGSEDGLAEMECVYGMAEMEGISKARSDVVITLMAKMGAILTDGYMVQLNEPG